MFNDSVFHSSQFADLPCVEIDSDELDRKAVRIKNINLLSGLEIVTPYPTWLKWPDLPSILSYFFSVSARPAERLKI